MGKPASRVGDNHLCPMMDGPKPHVGGPVLPPGTVTVLIGGQPAAAMGDMCLCVSPVPDSILLGSLGVFIGGRPAARLLDKTLHGGTLVMGAPTVLIGDISAVAGPAIFPGRQNHANCGVQCIQQVIRQTTGTVHSEEEMLHLALGGGFIKPKPAGFIGSTNPYTRHDMLAAHGIESTIVAPYQLETDDPSEIAAFQAAHNARIKQALTEALQADKAVIAGVDPGQLWHGEADYRGGHAVLITAGDFDVQGELTHVYINDTSGPTLAQQKGSCLPADRFLASMDKYKVEDEGQPLSCLNVIDTPMWNSIPIDLNPARLSGHSLS